MNLKKKLEELIDRLSELVTTPEPTASLAPSLAKDGSEALSGLINARKRLDFLEKNMTKSYIS